jgi:hypothetical protein
MKYAANHCKRKGLTNGYLSAAPKRFVNAIGKELIIKYVYHKIIESLRGVFPAAWPARIVMSSNDGIRHGQTPACAGVAIFSNTPPACSGVPLCKHCQVASRSIT